MVSQRCTKCCAPCVLISGVVTLFMGLLMGYFVIPYKIWEGVMKESKLVQGDNPRYNGWAKVPIPLYQRIYLFNVTNPEKVNQGNKPILEQLGPYVFQISLEKFDIVFNEGNGTFFYRERIQYFYRADLSNGSESDPITTINVPFVGMAQEALNLDSISRYILVEIMKEHQKEQLYLHTTAGQILFQGIFLPFIKDLSDLKGESILTNNTYGLLYGQNGTDQGHFEIYSGQRHPSRFGDIASWNGHSEFSWWSTDKFCNKLNGSDGIFEPYATRERVYHMFMPGICRSFPFEYEKNGDSQVYGVPVYKYSVPKRFLENPKDNPENTCYFAASHLLENPPESGVFPMRGCGKGPMMLSQPHFYQGSPTYLNQSIGLLPEKYKHEMSMFIEPYTATPMKVQVRFQMNVDLSPNKYFKSLRKIPKMVHPLFWMDQTTTIPEESGDTIRNSLIVALQIISVVTHVTVSIGALLILIALVKYTCGWYRCKNSNKSKNSDDDAENSAKHNNGSLRLFFSTKSKKSATTTPTSCAKETLISEVAIKSGKITPLISTGYRGHGHHENPDRSLEESVPFFTNSETINSDTSSNSSGGGDIIGTSADGTSSL